MLTAGTPSNDPWLITVRERLRYEEQFKSLKPINGIVTGEQAKRLFLQSQLPANVLGQIWSLADTDSDGKMNIMEFSIACKLINLKLRGFEVPTSLPPSLLASLNSSAAGNIIPTSSVAVITGQPLLPPQPSLLNGTSNVTTYNIPTSTFKNEIPPLIPGVGSTNTIPTGVVLPLQTTSTIASSTIPLVSAEPCTTLPLSNIAGISVPYIGPRAPSLPSTTLSATLPSSATVQPTSVSNLISVSESPSVTNTIKTSTNQSRPSISENNTGATNSPRTSIDKAMSIESIHSDWAVPHNTKLKYTQIFNTADRTRSGYLSGTQARNVMMQSKLPQNVLAQIWTLSDMDSDGRLGCEEFVLAMHLCEQALLGNLPPSKLPPELIPPSFKRSTRTASISSQSSHGTHIDQDTTTTLLQTSFEDKRKENFEKGQAELERRRKALLDQQRKEAEDRERKEREENERKEKARLEAERKRLEELEKHMREQQEQERLKEEERKRQAEQREAARNEMERQRQLEWEKQRLQELQQQRQREQENLLKMKAKKQTLSIEYTTLNDQIKDLSQKICDTRVSVSNVKSTIDGMRSTRDLQMQEMSKLKNKLKEQNQRLLSLSQEKVKLEAKNKLNMNTNNEDSDKAKIAFENKEITIKNLKEKVEDMQAEIDNKLIDIENNNSQLSDLKTQLTNLVTDCENMYFIYEEKKAKVLEMREKVINYGDNWNTNDAWNNASETKSDWQYTDNNWNNNEVKGFTSTDNDTKTVSLGDVIRYKAIYEFIGRNNDELSFQPGDIINVPKEQTGEPGWLVGELNNKTGWFPESYVEPINNVDENVTSISTEESTIKDIRLEGISELPETTDILPASTTACVSNDDIKLDDAEYYIANYPYQSQEQGDLVFNAGEIIKVTKKDGDWWTGHIDNRSGIFPSNYVQKIDASDVENYKSTAPATKSNVASASANALDNALQADNEVSQINEPTIERALDSSITNNAQVVKSKKPEIASVIAPYQATSSEQLSLARGQLIMIRKKTDSGWWEGELQAKGRKRQVGWFPASYVKVLNSSGRISGRTTPVSTTRMQQEVVIDKVVALFPYKAGNPDELSFEKDDIISVTAREEEAWWRGELNGVSGLFPSNYVTPLQQH